MNRRDLLKYLLATPLATVVDYEQILWVPKPQIVVSSITQVWEMYGGAVGGGKSIAYFDSLKYLYEKDDVFYKAIRRS